MTLEILRRDVPLPHNSVTVNSITQHSGLQNRVDAQQLKMTHKCVHVCVCVISQFGPKHLKAPLKECEPLDLADVS